MDIKERNVTKGSFDVGEVPLFYVPNMRIRIFLSRFNKFLDFLYFFLPIQEIFNTFRLIQRYSIVDDFAFLELVLKMKK
jgi:hypothetical protein